jgi:hypothetical protein
MAPGDPRLPGGGNQICGLYDVNPTQFGQTNNLVTLASDFGNQTEVFNGIDGTVNARFGKGGVLQGGIGTGRTVTDNCYQNSFPNLTASGYVAGTPRTAAFCRVTLPWSAQTQVKFAGVYPLPWDTQVSAVFQNLPGIPVQANTVFTNAQIVSSLGRNLAACPATGTCTAAATIPVITPNTVFEDRRTQVDVRLTKIFQMGKVRVQGRFDVFNLFNTSGILAENLTYGPSWLRPIGILGARLYKVGGQVDF